MGACVIQVLDHGYIKLIETWGSDERIIESARMSTGKGFAGWGTTAECDACGGDGTEQKSHGRGPGSRCKPCNGSGRRINVPGDEKLLRFLWENKHHTPFEMAGATFEIQAPIFVFREWHRHRTQSYNEMSARYTPLPDLNYSPTVERLMMVNPLNKQTAACPGSEGLTLDSSLEWLAALTDLYEHSERVYQRGLMYGVPKELARLAVTVARYSRMRASANLRNWLGFFTLRQAPNAQWEIRQYANPACDMLAGYFPRTISLFEEDT